MWALAGAYSDRGLLHRAGAPFVLGAIGAVAQLVGGPATMSAGLAFFLLGLSHGAGDENAGAIRPYGPVEIAAYVLVGSAIAALFLMRPTAGLALFFMLSLWHFVKGHSGFGQFARLAIAAVAIGGSALFRPEATASALGAVAGAAIPGAALGALAIIGASGVLLAALSIASRDGGWDTAIASVLAALFFHPVLAVGYIFLAGHAWPIQRGQIGRFGLRAAWRAVRWPTLAAAAGAILLIAAVAFEALPVTLVAAFAFGMATPHMLVERVEP